MWTTLLSDSRYCCLGSRYSSLIDTMGKKFAKKRKSGDAKNEKSKKKNKKNKFLKPSDD